MDWIFLILDLIFKVVSIIAVLAVVGITAAHYFFFGPHFPELAKEKRDTRRFTRWEIFIHIITLLSFITLAVTGFIAVIFLGGPVTGLLRIIHLIAAPVFAAGMFLVTLRWAEDCTFESYDLEWLKKAGGYLWHVEDVPAGKFNAGQKGFFWAILILGVLTMLSGLALIFPVFGSTCEHICYQLHRYCSLFMLITVIFHIYFGTFANPGTFRAVITGYVSSSWLKKHHPKLSKNT